MTVYEHRPIEARTNEPCPDCGKLLMLANPGQLLLSSPPKQAVYCPDVKCGYSGFIIQKSG